MEERRDDGSRNNRHVVTWCCHQGLMTRDGEELQSLGVGTEGLNPRGYQVFNTPPEENLSPSTSGGIQRYAPPALSSEP